MRKEHDAALKKYAHTQQAHATAVKKHAIDVAALEKKLESANDVQEPKLAKKLASLEANPPAPLAPCPKPRMQPEEVRLVLQLATSLKLLLAPVTTAQDRKRGASLLYDYLVGYKQV